MLQNYKKINENIALNYRHNLIMLRNLKKKKEKKLHSCQLEKRRFKKFLDIPYNQNQLTVCTLKIALYMQ